MSDLLDLLTAASFIKVENVSTTTVSGLSLSGVSDSSTFGDSFPASGVAAGFKDSSSNMSSARTYDLNTGAGVEEVLGVNLRGSGPSGSIEIGTSSNPVRVDPTGSTAQPITDNGSSLTVDNSGTFAVQASQAGTWNLNDITGTVSLPTGAATETTLLDVLTTAAFQARINTLGQKTSDNSTPVVLASDQSSISVTQSGIVDVNLVGLNGTIDSGNSSSTPLGSGGIFTGTALETLDIASISIFLFSDKASAPNGLSLQFSVDNVNWDSSLAFTVAGNEATDLTIPPRTKYFRIKYTNGSLAQTSFRLQTIYKTISLPPATVRIVDTVDPNGQAALTKSSIVGKTTAGGSSFIDVKVSPSGALTVDASGSSVIATQSGVWTVTANAGTNLNTSLLALESGGNLAATATSLSIMDDWDESNRAAVNTISGQAGVQGGSGFVTNNTQRVVLATDISLPSGINNIGDVDIATLSGTIDTGNSTTTLLTAGSVFTGIAFDTLNYPTTCIIIKPSHPSATDGFSFQWSPDGTNWDVISNSSVNANEGRGFHVSHRGRYFRIVYTNGASNQTSFRLGVIHRPSSVGLISRPLDANIDDDNYAQQVRAVLAAQTPGGSYVNIDCNNTGHLKVTNDSVYAEDSLSINGDNGTAILGYRNDGGSPTTTASGDYSFFSVDSAGRIGIADLGGSITVDGTVVASELQPSSSNVTSVSASASSVTLLAANSLRKQAFFYNDSALATLRLKLGATASSTSFTVLIQPGGFYEIPYPVYTGIVDGIWSVASGSARITELT